MHQYIIPHASFHRIVPLRHDALRTLVGLQAAPGIQHEQLLALPRRLQVPALSLSLSHT